MDVPQNFSAQLKELSDLNKTCFDGLYSLGQAEVLKEFGVDSEEEIPKDKWDDYVMKIYHNKYIQLNNKIFLLVELYADV